MFIIIRTKNYNNTVKKTPVFPVVG